jgi:Tfp pilus assembly protein PilF
MDVLTRETDAISRQEYLATQMRVLWVYIRLFVLPIKQHLDYDMVISSGFFDGAVIAALLGHLSCLAIAIWAGKKHPFVLFGVAFYYLAHLVESSAIPIRDVVFEHRTYLPNFGLSIVLTYAYLRFADRIRSAKLFLAGLILLIAVLGCVTYTRNLVWSDAVTLWEDNVRKTPEKARPHNNLGLAYARMDRLDEAVNHFKRAIEISPRFADAYTNLGNTYMLQGKVEDAMKSFLSALEIDPAKAGAYNNIGLLYYELGVIDRAKVYIEKALEIEPDNLRSQINLGGILYLQQDFAGAEGHYLKALQLEPGNAEALHNLGLVSAVHGDFEKAVSLFNEAIKSKPDLVAAYKDLAIVLDRSGKKDEALIILAKALEIKPDYLEAQHYYQIISKGETTSGPMVDGPWNSRD